MSLLRPAAVLLFLAATVAAQTPPAGPPVPAEPLRTAADRPFDITHIKLELAFDLERQEAAGTASLDLKALREARTLRLDAVDLEVSRVTFRVAPNAKTAEARFDNDGKTLTVDFAEPVPAGAARTLMIDYRVRQPKAGLYFFRPSPTEPDVPFNCWSQGEPTTNRHWFPCADHPNQRQTTETVITVAKGYEALSNGVLVSRKDTPDGKSTVFHWKQEQPHVAYLVMVAIGRYAVVKDEWRGKPVLYYVPPARKADIERTFGRTKEMLDFFSGRFGIDYPWDKYAQVVVEQFNAGGMENTSATTLNDRALHDARASLDSDADGLIAHELGHQWWGDLVTCKDWSHLWLNEGFASYCEVLWDEHRRGPDHAAVNLLNKAKAAMAGGKDRPVVDRRYTSPGAMFDARVYPKGAWVLHMLRRRLGDDAFFRCIRRWGTEYRLRTADTDDFRKVLEAETGRSLERFFYDFTERPGHPVVEVGVEWLAESKLVKVTAKQTQAGEAFEIPLVVEFRCGGGDSARTVTLRETMADKEARFFLPLPDRPAMVRVDPEQSVLAEWKESKGRDLWLAQLHDDPHPVQRIRAARHFGESKSPADREALAKALAREGFFGVAAEIAAALGESGGDTCRDALLAGLKHEHPKVRRACAAEMGKFPREPAVTDVLRALLDKGDASYFVEAAAAESYGKARAADAVSVLTPLLDRPSHNEVIRSAALSGLAEAGDVTALSTLLAWTARGKPRPVRIAALRAVDRLMTIGNPDDDSRKAAVAAVTRCLESDSRPVRQAAAETLRGLGRSAAPALPVLEAIARHDPDDRVRELAGRAAERVRSDSPAPVELSRLREELDRLRKANEALAEKVERIERK